MLISKTLGIPLMEGLPNSAEELPAIITYMVLHRSKIDSFAELPKDKKPPRDLWDKPFKLSEFFDEVFDTKKTKKKRATFIEYNQEDVE